MDGTARSRRGRASASAARRSNRMASPVVRTSLGPMLLGLAVPLALAALALAAPGEAPALHPRISQDQITSGELDLAALRMAGMRVFSTPFNRLDGYGDGPENRTDTTSPGGRPTLQGNGTFLRVNGLDAQSCLDCHSIVSAASVPARLGIGGVGTANNNAIVQPTAIDVADHNDVGHAGFDGRFANPPFVFGLGGVELLGLEMTADLQALRQAALDAPGTPVALVTKGVSFGTLVAHEDGSLDTSGVEGVDDDLVVKPFGRKGEFATSREFDVGALQFHLGMQAVENVGPDVDADQDGVVNEVSVGELSALGSFVSTLERPFMERLGASARRGERLFLDVGCADCHRPTLATRHERLPLRFPEDRVRPFDHAYLSIDLTRSPPGFQKNHDGGVDVPLFADLKRHDMGPGLAEGFARANAKQNREFTTARLWGVADTAPYLHDGRAMTLTDAILLHGGEAEGARDAFQDLSDTERVDLLSFLRSLRTPERPAKDLLEKQAASGHENEHEHGSRTEPDPPHEHVSDAKPRPTPWR